MTEICTHEAVLRNVKVPLSLLARPERFGDQRDQDCLSGDLVIRAGKAIGLTAASEAEAPTRLVLPRLTECHVHLDKCHTISRMEGVGGDLVAAIEAQAADRQNWTADDIRARAARGLDELISAGCGAIRSHVDWGAEISPLAPAPSWKVLCELVQEYQNKATVQLAALTGADDMADPEVADVIARQVASAGGVLGVFTLDHLGRREGIRNAFAVAEKYQLALDFHVDEGLKPGLDGLDIIADEAMRTGFQGPVLCGHACSLMNIGTDALKPLAEKLARAGVAVACLPSSNLYLQGRGDGTPDRRGLTRVRELLDAGVRVLAGTDNVRDAFCPLGRHDPLHSLALAALAAHLDPPYGQFLPMITTNAEHALGLAPTYVDGAAIGDLLLFDAATTPDLLAGGGAPVALADAIKGELQ